MCPWLFFLNPCLLVFLTSISIFFFFLVFSHTFKQSVSLLISFFSLSLSLSFFFFFFCTVQFYTLDLSFDCLHSAKVLVTKIDLYREAFKFWLTLLPIIRYQSSLLDKAASTAAELNPS
ncbi:MAG: hypothetical protein J3Q66DRAFT_149231 [Benniella sp.]|nr:MAG: hypothetical protein J3Q66DRAFT_149231 [Benniella sp.]